MSRRCFLAAVGLLLPVTTTACDYTELKGRLIPAGDSSVSSHLDPNASSLDLRGKSEGLKQMCLLRFPGVGRERAAEENPLSSATSVTGETK